MTVTINGTGTGTFTDASSNVGVGTSSPSVRVHVVGAGNSPRVRMESTGGAIFELLADSNTSGVISTNTSHPIIFQTASVIRATLDTSGYFTTPYVPCFSAINTGSPQSAGVIQYSSATLNNGNHYNTSTYRFTAPVAGRYCFSANTIGTTGSAVSFYLRKNGTPFSGVAWGGTANGNESSAATTAIVLLAAGDYVDAYSNSNLYNSNYGNFSGFLIG